jgi:hypothetical protein
MGKECEEIELLIMSIFKVILVLSDVIIKQRIMRKPTFSQYYAHREGFPDKIRYVKSFLPRYLV